MRRYLVVLMALTLVFALGTMTAVYGGPGPAPNSGDGIPDGSGFAERPGSNGSSNAIGPAPNSGDGVPDGSGF